MSLQHKKEEETRLMNRLLAKGVNSIAMAAETSHQRKTNLKDDVRIP
jgi:hypothetical protein